MKFRVCKHTIIHLMLEGLAVLMLSGLIGCGGNGKESAEDIAGIYLKKRYHKEFVVEELTRKDAGPFKTKEYSGYAYEKNNPENRFKVWVNKNNAQVSDAYYGVTVIPGIKQWIQSETSAVWENVNAGVVLDVLRPGSNAEYRENEYIDFLENESVECDVYLFIKSNNELTPERYIRFDKAIKEKISGYVRIYVVNDYDLSSVNIADYFHQEPDISIRIGAPASVIEKELRSTTAESPSPG